MKRLLSYSVVMFVITIILLLIIPLPAGLVDVAIILNMSLSMMILVITMTIREPLEFSIFPSLLLITTLFRLGINVSTTRNILSQGGSSGRVIAAFGDFVLRGNVVVGLIIFLIIVLMQFIVITKGAERVAEVAARFNLDAMPGKQMAIDADLSSGLINETQAKERRAKVQREADFYGAMDGATKIVKGDAVMSLITTAINLIGGSIIGIVQSGSSISAVLSTYSIATVGDGLVSQIPALLISTATGMIVTRAVSEGSLNEDVSKQFLAQPHAMIVSGAAVAVMAVIPGMPAVRTLVVAACLMGSGFYLSGKIKKEPQALSQMAMAPSTQLQDSPQAQAAAAKEEVSEEEYFKDVNNVYSLLTLEPVEIEFGYSLIPLADESVGGRLISRIVIFRRQYAQDMGFVIPSIRLRDSSSLGPSQYSIRIKGEEIEGIEAIEPAYGIPSRWIKPENRDRAELYGYTVIDPLSVLLMHLSEVIRQHSYELLTRQEVVRLTENLKKTAPELVEEAIPQMISYSYFQRVLTNLLKEGIPVRDLETIVENLMQTASETGLPPRELDQTVEKIRTALKRTITRMYCTDGCMKVITLDAQLEREMVASLSKGENGLYLALNPEMLQHVIRQLAEQIKKFSGLSQNPVILTSQVMRIHFYHLVEPFYPNIRVLSFNEIANNVQIQSIGNISTMKKGS